MNKLLCFRPSLSACIAGFSVSFAVSLAGCVAPAGSESGADASVQAHPAAVNAGRIIVKFQPGVDPANGLFLRELSAALRVSLVYLHPLAGGAHVLQARGYNDGAHWLELVAALNRRAEVVYAEPDARMRHQ